ncbi:MAG: ferrous iron transport protein A [Defluviitaleaceae bacterium]|nr:ferrous iron transport protein A [Defluviitaleaceae bacterium]
MACSIVNLYEATKGEAFQIASVPKIGMLENLGLRVGTFVTVQSRFALGGPVLLRVEDSFAVAIGKDIATQIAVRETVAS